MFNYVHRVEITPSSDSPNMPLCYTLCTYTVVKVDSTVDINQARASL